MTMMTKEEMLKREGSIVCTMPLGIAREIALLLAAIIESNPKGALDLDDDSKAALKELARITAGPRWGDQLGRALRRMNESRYH